MAPLEQRHPLCAHAGSSAWGALPLALLPSHLHLGLLLGPPPPGSSNYYVPDPVLSSDLPVGVILSPCLDEKPARGPTTWQMSIQEGLEPWAHLGHTRPCHQQPLSPLGNLPGCSLLSMPPGLYPDAPESWHLWVRGQRENSGCRVASTTDHLEQDVPHLEGSVGCAALRTSLHLVYSGRTQTS